MALPSRKEGLRKNCPAKIADETDLFFPEGDTHGCRGFKRVVHRI